MTMVEKVASAIEDVQLFINTIGCEELQICRREKDGGHTVVSRHPYDEDGVVELRQAVRLERARAAISAGQMGWLPIETAPKDGTIIVAWDGDGVLLTAWNDEARGPGVSGYIQKPGWVAYSSGIEIADEGWDTGNSYSLEAEPTHWMPTPGAPMEEKL